MTRTRYEVLLVNDELPFDDAWLHRDTKVWGQILQLSHIVLLDPVTALRNDLAARKSRLSSRAAGGYQ